MAMGGDSSLNDTGDNKDVAPIQIKWIQRCVQISTEPFMERVSVLRTVAYVSSPYLPT